jgi:hypothetical protein
MDSNVAMKYDLVLTFFVKKNTKRNKIIGGANLRVFAIFEQYICVILILILAFHRRYLPIIEGVYC